MKTRHPPGDCEEATAITPRLVTWTLNPAIDFVSTAPALCPTHKIRTRDEHVDPGGGGVNVARVARALGGEGAILATETGILRRPAPAAEVHSAVGAVAIAGIGTARIERPAVERGYAALHARRAKRPAPSSAKPL